MLIATGQKRPFYQDRLGTNIGKESQKKRLTGKNAALLHRSRVFGLKNRAWVEAHQLAKPAAWWDEDEEDEGGEQERARDADADDDNEEGCCACSKVTRVSPTPTPTIDS